MTPIQLLALTRLFNQAESKKIRSGVTEGEYDVDFNVHVRGTMKVEADTDKASTVSIPWTEVYALLREILLQGIDGLLERVARGETVGRAELEGFRNACGLGEDLLVETIQRAWEISRDSKARGEIIKRFPEVKDAQRRALDAIVARLDRTHVDGKVHADMTVEEIVPSPQISDILAPSEEKVAGTIENAEQKV
jgi:hypothetical protein